MNWRTGFNLASLPTTRKTLLALAGNSEVSQLGWLDFRVIFMGTRVPWPCLWEMILIRYADVEASILSVDGTISQAGFPDLYETGWTEQLLEFIALLSWEQTNVTGCFILLLSQRYHHDELDCEQWPKRNLCSLKSLLSESFITAAEEGELRHL